MTRLRTAATALHTADLAQRNGLVSNLIGLIIEATGLQAEVGEVCHVHTDRTGPPVSAEVVGFREGRTLLMPLGELHGIGPGTKVVGTGAPFRVAVGASLLGRVIDGLGDPLDELGASASEAPLRAGRAGPMTGLRSTIAPPPSAASRPRIDRRVGLGVRTLDGLVPCGLGQRLGGWRDAVPRRDHPRLFARHASALPERSRR